MVSEDVCFLSEIILLFSVCRTVCLLVLARLRGESVRRVGELACLFTDAGMITVVSLVSPYREDRDSARKRHTEQGLKFLEVFMDVPLTVVQDRDPKGLYAKVAAG